MAKSLTSATNLLSRLAVSREGNTVTNDNMFKAFDKKPDDQNDVNFIASILSTLRSYNFITTNYSQGWPRRRESVTLTPEAITVLESRPLSDIRPKELKRAPMPKAISISTVRQDIEKLRELEPELDIIFDVKLKERVMQQDR